MKLHAGAVVLCMSAAAVVACGVYGEEQKELAPVADADGGTEASADGQGGACKPNVVDPSAPDECGANVENDALNCGTCGHQCIDAPCEGGRCVAERLTTSGTQVFALDGTMLYVPVDTDIERADLSKRPAAFEPFVDGIFGDIVRLEAYAGELYVSTSQQAVVVGIADRTTRGNEHVARAAAARADGFFFPGKVAYYEYAGASGGRELARIDTETGSLRYKKAASFFPVARSGDELFWTETLTGGAQIWGAWEAESGPVVRVGTAIAGFAVDGSDVYFVAGGFVRRASAGALVDIAQEPGTGLDLALAGNDLFYAVKRSSAAEDGYRVYRVDKCRGGRPVLVFESVGVPITRIAVDGATHVIVATASGIFRARR